VIAFSGQLFRAANDGANTHAALLTRFNTGALPTRCVSRHAAPTNKASPSASPATWRVTWNFGRAIWTLVRSWGALLPTMPLPVPDGRGSVQLDCSTKF
jgi:hypothetical protein